METNSTIARPYATACFEFAREQANVLEALDFWSEVLHYSSEIVNSDAGTSLIQNSLGTQNKVYEFLLHCLPENLLTTEVKNFLSVVRDNHRFTYLTAIYGFFTELRRSFDLPTSVIIISAREFSEEQIKNVENKISSRLGKLVKAKVEIDPSVVTGFIIKYDDEVIDCSGREFLNKISLFVSK